MAQKRYDFVSAQDERIDFTGLPNQVFVRDGITEGTYPLSNIKRSEIRNGDIAIVVHNGQFRLYRFDENETATKDGNIYVAPSDNPSGRWVLQMDYPRHAYVLDRDFPTLEDAINHAVTNNKLLVISKEWNVATNAEINADMTVLKSGKFNVGSGVTLAINGSLQAGLYQIFDGDGNVSGTPKIEAVYPEWFGAKGDGVTNDTNALKKLSAFVNSASGGLVRFQKKTYIVGEQTFAGSVGLGYSFQAEPILHFENCKLVEVDLNGATLKAADGLKFGSFDPVTGDPYHPSLPFYDYDYRANAYTIISAVNCRKVIVKNGEIDGNISEIELGGQWGDAGYQCDGYGLYIMNTESLIIENMYIHHCALDGLLIGFENLTEASQSNSFILKNVNSLYNARQGLSWTGGIGLTAINCSFSHTGRSTFTSAPGSGIDFEQEGSSVVRSGIFINCSFENNVGSGITADSGDVADISFINCKAVGTTNWSAWIRKPRFRFFGCMFVGAVTSAGFSDPNESPQYYSCTFTDEDKYSPTGQVYGDYLYEDPSAQGVQFHRCTFIAEKRKLAWIEGNSNNLAVLKDCRFILRAGTDYIPNQDFCLLLESCHVENVTVEDQIDTNPPSDAYYVNYDFNNVYLGIVKTTSDKIKWYNWSWGVSNEPIPLTHFPPLTALLLTTNQSPTTGRNKIIYNSAAPTSGVWTKGDIIFNTNPAVDANNMVLLGWICTQSGEFGVNDPVFKPMYASVTSPAT